MALAQIGMTFSQVWHNSPADIHAMLDDLNLIMHEVRTHRPDKKLMSPDFHL